MRLVLLALCALAFASGISRQAFDQWKSRFNKEYANENEYDYRYSVWKENTRFIQNWNAQNGPVELGMNHFGDLTHEEFKAQYLHSWKPHAMNNSNVFVSNAKALPTAVDWRTKGAVGPVQDQGPCGSCWAFSSTAAIEAAHFIATKNFVKLSEQQLIDCCTTCQGCEGGFMPDAFQCIIDAGGQDRANCYPYECASRTCRFQKTCVGATIADFQEVPEGDEAALAAAVAARPVSIGIDASHISLQFYKSGIYDDSSCSSTDIDHAVFLVGYNNAATPYWIIRNSWGSNWGIQGYVWIRKDKNNRCGVATAGSYPISA